MPPQQGQPLLDLVGQMSDLGAHETSGDASSGGADGAPTGRQYTMELRWNAAYYRLALSL